MKTFNDLTHGRRRPLEGGRLHRPDIFVVSFPLFLGLDKRSVLCVQDWLPTPPLSRRQLFPWWYHLLLLLCRREDWHIPVRDENEPSIPSNQPLIGDEPWLCRTAGSLRRAQKSDSRLTVSFDVFGYLILEIKLILHDESAFILADGFRSCHVLTSF